jgi:HSP20 family protein
MGSLLGDVVGGEHRPYGVLAALVPAVEVEETDGAFLIELELPGVDPEDVSIDLKDNELFVTGEIKERERRGKLRRQTRRLGHFEHQITLPGAVDPESVTASLDNGVLTVRLAKARSSQPRHVEISKPTATQSGRTIDDTSGQYTDAATRSSEAESSEAAASSAQTSGAGSSDG